MSIDHHGNAMIIFMESAELDKDDIEDNVVLGRDSRIRGKLHIESIKSVQLNSKRYFVFFKKKYDEGGIVNFEITNNSVLLAIDWVNFLPKPAVNEFSVIKIEAEKIWWENIPSQGIT